jgi:hypothetical protein
VGGEEAHAPPADFMDDNPDPPGDEFVDFVIYIEVTSSDLLRPSHVVCEARI